MSELLGNDETKREALKSLIKRLHKGADPQILKKEFADLVRGISPAEIARVEEELIREGIPMEEIRRLCDLHIAVFRESLEESKPSVETGHPLHILTEEHSKMLDFASKLRELTQDIRGSSEFDEIKSIMVDLDNVVRHLKEAESHYLREENVLFPYLEKHGVTQPPAIMWTEHDMIRDIKKNLFRIVENGRKMPFKTFSEQIDAVSQSLMEMLSSHFYKENNILFPTALSLISEDEWKDIRIQFDEIGYCCFTPPRSPPAIQENVSVAPGIEEIISFPTGTLTSDEIAAIFNTLPLDMTFVDRQDTVKYFNNSKERIFIRTKAVLGRKVQQCHPQKSIHVVNRILEEFKSGKRDHADFWINLKGRMVYIRYFAVRNRKGDYLGTLEVTQDVTEIRKLEGERRLMS